MRADTFAGRVVLALRRDPTEALPAESPPSSFFGRLRSALRGTDVFAQSEPADEANDAAPAVPTAPARRPAETPWAPPVPVLRRDQEPPRYVVRDGTEADTVLRRLVRAGWVAREGFALPAPSWDLSASRLVLHGRVVEQEDLQLAVLAAARGAGIVAVADETSPIRRALIEDLRRLGAVDEQADPPEGAAPADDLLMPEQRALLRRLAAGDTVAGAAAAEYLSLRTANRRIAEARALLGVRTTREAVLAYLRRGQSRSAPVDEDAPE